MSKNFTYFIKNRTQSHKKFIAWLIHMRSLSIVLEMIFFLETFIVAKALVEMKNRTIHLGISSYTKGFDEIILLSYYNKMWFLFGVATIISFMILKVYIWFSNLGLKLLIQYFFVKPLILVDPFEEYVNSLGYNDSFAWYYISPTSLPLSFKVCKCWH